MIKKITALILTIFLLCALSTGCKSDDKATDNKEKAPEKIEYKPDPATIVVYVPSVSNEYLKRVKDLEDKIRDTLNITFHVQVIPNMRNDPNAVEKLLESGAEYDLLFTYAPVGGSHLDKTYNNADLIAKGYFMDITDLLPLYAPNYYSRFSPEDIQAISYNDRIYNIPDLTFESQRPCVLVWKSLVEKYEIKDIKTFNDYENYMQLLKEKERDYYPSSNCLNYGTQIFIETTGYVMLYGNIVYKRDDPEMKLIPWEQTEAFKEAVNTLRRWWDKGYDMFSSGARKDETEGSYIFDNLPFGLSKTLGKRYRDTNDEWILYQLYPDVMISRSTPNRRIFISKNSKNAERILRFIEWINASQENYDIGSVIGPGNFYYHQYDDGYIYYFEKEEYIDAVTRNSTYPPHAGYNPPARVMEKIAERCADFEAFYAKCDYSDEAVEEFIQQQKDKGIDTLVKELQEDLDAWRRKQSG